MAHLRIGYVHLRTSVISDGSYPKQQKSPLKNGAPLILLHYSYSLRAGSGLPSWSCSQAVSKPVWHIPLLCVQWKTPDDGQRNCPKHVEIYSKNKFEKISAYIWFYYKSLSRCTVTWTLNISTMFWNNCYGTSPNDVCLRDPVKKLSISSKWYFHNKCRNVSLYSTIQLVLKLDMGLFTLSARN